MSNPDRCHCHICTGEGLMKVSKEEIGNLLKVAQAAIEVAYDPSKQPAMVLTLIETGFIKIGKE